MNKKLVGMVVFLAANSAVAQSSVEVYGIIDVAVGHVENSLSTDPNFGSTVNSVTATKATVNNGVTGMINGGIQGSRWGLRGTEDLGDGLKAFFTLESGFNPQTGGLANAAASLSTNSPTATTASSNSSQDGQLFNRQAFVGLSHSSLGSIAFGRNYNPIYDVMTDYDPVLQSQAFSLLGASGTYGGGGGISEDTRLDNSIKYKNKIGDVNLGVLYKIGGQAGNTAAQSGYALSLGYESGPFGIQGIYEQFTDAIKGSTGTGGNPAVTVYDTQAELIAAKYIFGQATIRGGWERYTLSAASDYSPAGSISYFGYTPSSISSYGFVTATGASNGAGDQPVNIYFIGGDYNFTPALNLALGYYDVQLSSYNAIATAALTPSASIKAFSALLDYHFSKRTDVYGGLMDLSYGGLYAAPTYNTSNYIAAVGIRTKF